MQLDVLVAQVMAHPKYQHITKDFVFRLSQEAISKGLTGKSAVKYVRNKCHQVGGAYFKRKTDYTTPFIELATLPKHLGTEQVKAFCREMMGSHTSTAERLPILGDFFNTCLAPIAPITSVIDLACGLNPLAIPWMPLAEDAHYFAYDIYVDMLAFIDRFFEHFSLAGKAQPCDLVSATPAQTAQVAFLLKSIPCLEQMDKSIGLRLLEQTQSDHILVSFPAQSLGGRQKGMPNFYRDHFQEIVSGKTWRVREFRFESELAFLVSK